MKRARVDQIQEGASCANMYEIELFDDKPTQVELQGAYYTPVAPINAITEKSPIEFDIKSSGNEYIDLNDIRLFVSFSVKSETVIADADRGKSAYGFANLPLSSLFSNATLMLNQVQVEGGSHLLPYTNYIYTLLNYSAEASKNLLSPWGFVKDSPGRMEPHKDNEGIVGRLNGARHGKGDMFYVDGPLPFDFFRQKKFLLNNVNVRVKLQPASDAFFLMQYKTESGTGYTLPKLKVVINEATLSVRKVSLLPSIVWAHDEGLQKYNAVYPYLRTEARSYSIQKDSRSHVITDVFGGRVPKRIIVCMVSNLALNGDMTRNPFNLQHFKLICVDLQLNGQSIPQQPLECDFTGSCVREYNTFVQSTGNYLCNKEFSIGLFDYKDGYTLFAFNLTPDFDLYGKRQPYTTGDISLHLAFQDALAEVVSVICVGYEDAAVHITRSRNIELR